MEPTYSGYDYVPIEWTKEARKRDWQRIVCTSLIIGSLALYASAQPIKKHYVHFPKGSVVRRLSQQERRAGAIASAAVPIESVDQIDCGGRDALLFKQFDLDNGIVIMQDNPDNLVIDCAERNSPLDKSDHIRLN